MKHIVAIVLLAFSVLVSAQPTSFDGTWLKKGLDAYERVNVAKTGTGEDLNDALSLISYTSGVLAVRRQNNLLALVVIGTLGRSNASAPARKLSPVEEARVKTALAFAPLFRLPDSASPEQLLAIVQRYIAAHPEKWNTAAQVLITDALVEAFAKP